MPTRYRRSKCPIVITTPVPAGHQHTVPETIEQQPFCLRASLAHCMPAAKGIVAKKAPELPGSERPLQAPWRHWGTWAF
jgi:hypothetical protein